MDTSDISFKILNIDLSSPSLPSSVASFDRIFDNAHYLFWEWFPTYLLKNKEYKWVDLLLIPNHLFKDEIGINRAHNENQNIY